MTYGEKCCWLGRYLAALEREKLLRDELLALLKRRQIRVDYLDRTR